MPAIALFSCLRGCSQPRKSSQCNHSTTQMPALEQKSARPGCRCVHSAGLRPQDIDILVTNCSIYCPTPSLASMLVNKFKMRQDVQSYHLGGMGCGNGVMAFSLIRDLLQARPNSIAVFVPSEITTYCFYPGLQKDYMVRTSISQAQQPRRTTKVHAAVLASARTIPMKTCMCCVSTGCQCHLPYGWSCHHVHQQAAVLAHSQVPADAQCSRAHWC
jgi:FAE1/Type III polyketide synthase-like protein